MKKSKSIFSLVVILLLIALFITAALNGLNLGFYKVEAAKDGIPLGLDLVGGSEITYEAQIPAGTSEVRRGDQVSVVLFA